MAIYIRRDKTRPHTKKIRREPSFYSFFTIVVAVALCYVIQINNNFNNNAALVVIVVPMHSSSNAHHIGTNKAYYKHQQNRK